MKKLAIFLCFLVCLAFGFDVDLGSDCRAAFPNDGQAVAAVQLDGKSAMQIIWDSAKRSDRLECWWPSGTEIPECKKVQGRITFKKTPATGKIRCYIRFRDRQGEIFDTHVTLTEEGSVLNGTFELDPAAKHSSWINNPKTDVKDGVVDFPVKVSSMCLNFEKNGKSGDVYVTSLSLTPEGAKTEVKAVPAASVRKGRKVEFDISTEHPGRTICAGGFQWCYGVIQTLPKPTVYAVISFKVRDWSGNIVGEVKPHRWCLLYDHCLVERLPIPKRFGIYYVEAKVAFPEDPASDCVLHRSFAYLKPTGHSEPYKDGQFRFGTSCEPGQSMQIRNDRLRILETMGIRFLRSHIAAIEAMPVKDVVQFEYNTSFAEQLRDCGIETQLLIYGCSRWMVADQSLLKPKVNYYPLTPNLDAWRIYIRQVLSHYKGLVRYYEIWNEPDLENFAAFDVDVYQQMVKIAVEERDKINPDAVICTAGFCNFDKKNQFHARALEACKHLAQIHFFHGHGIYTRYKDTIEQKLLPLRKKVGVDKSMPWWANETSLTSTGFGERAQAVNVCKKVIFSMARGSMGYIWFSLNNRGFNPSDPEHNYGIFTYDMYPKACYPAYTALIGVYNGNTVYVRDLNLADAEGYLFRRDNTLLAALWSTRGGLTTELTFRTDAKKAEVIDIFGNVSEVSVLGGLVSVPATEEHCTLRMIGATFCEPSVGPVSVEKTALCVRTGEDVKVLVRLANPLASTQKYDIHIRLPKGLTGKTDYSVLLKPGEASRIECVFQSDMDNLARNSAIAVEYAMSSGAKGKISVSVDKIVRLSKDFPAMPFAELKDRKQVYEYFDANPGTVFRLWKGPADLSAKIYLAGDRTSLRLKAVVTDDVHVQEESAENIWRADSMQMYLQFANTPLIWQMGCGLHKDGRTLKAVWTAPYNRKDGLLNAMDAKVTRSGKETTYLLTIPWSAFGVTDAVLRQGVRFNVMFNERDSDERDSYMFMVPGVADSVSADAYPRIEIAH